jgi:glycosyltransferase involved in cell wall biosynthesis
MNEYLVILPAYNEASYIGRVIDEIISLNKGVDIVVVNDGSKDKTPLIAEEKGVVVINHPVNIGYGAALQTGFRYAQKKGYKYVITMDADGQHDPGSIGSLIEASISEEADVVVGSRFLEGGYRMPFMRRIGSWLFARIARLYTGYKFTDPTSGFQLLNRKAFSYLAAEEHYPLDYPDVNIIMLLHKKKFKVVEAPVKMSISPDTDSMHSGLKPFFYVIRMILAIMLVILRKED